MTAPTIGNIAHTRHARIISQNDYISTSTESGIKHDSYNHSYPPTGVKKIDFSCTFKLSKKGAIYYIILQTRIRSKLESNPINQTNRLHNL
jgi:hypothetical protein